MTDTNGNGVDDTQSNSRSVILITPPSSLREHSPKNASPKHLHPAMKRIMEARFGQLGEEVQDTRALRSTVARLRFCEACE